MTDVEYLKSQRTLSQAEVDKRAAMHDANDFTPAERLNFTPKDEIHHGR